MQFTTTAFLATIPVVLAANNANVQGWANTGCSGDTRVVLTGYSGFYSTCVKSYSSSVKVTGAGCQTYYYSDTNCKNSLFSGTVPDSNCYGNVGSFVIYCN